MRQESAEASPKRPVTLAEATDVLYHEAHCLDSHLWPQWLELYEPDAWFWLPSWRDEGQLTQDPQRELSLIYYDTRVRLEERVWRLTSGRSPASIPLSRTLHSISNIRLAGAADMGWKVLSNVVVHSFNPKRKKTNTFFGQCEHVLRLSVDSWRIAGKKFILLNDYMPSVLDIYTI